MIRFFKMWAARLALLAPLLARTAAGQTTGEVQENQPWRLLFDHSGLYATAVYLNGAKLTNFTISQITMLTNNSATNYTFSVNMPALERGFYAVTATSQFIAANGVVVESDPSPPLNLKAKPRPPWYLRLF